MHQVIYVSATPGPWEVQEAGGEIVQQIIRPTGLLDPHIEVRPAANQVDDVLEEIRKATEKGGRVLVTTLTKKLSEDLTKYLTDIGIKATLSCIPISKPSNGSRSSTNSAAALSMSSSASTFSAKVSIFLKSHLSPFSMPTKKASPQRNRPHPNLRQSFPQCRRPRRDVCRQNHKVD